MVSSCATATCVKCNQPTHSSPNLQHPSPFRNATAFILDPSATHPTSCDAYPCATAVRSLYRQFTAGLMPITCFAPEVPCRAPSQGNSHQGIELLEKVKVWGRVRGRGSTRLSRLFKEIPRQRNGGSFPPLDTVDGSHAESGRDTTQSLSPSAPPITFSARAAPSSHLTYTCLKIRTWPMLFW